MKKALITGITGQDGSYLAEYLLSLGYEVHGLIRWVSTPNVAKLKGCYRDVHGEDVRFFLHYADLTDSSSLFSLCQSIKPDEIYHLGAQSHVRVSFDIPEQTGNVTALATTRLLEAIRKSDLETRFYQASSSEMFGAASPPQNEDTEFHPRSPYAVSKVYSYWATINYRESYDMYACNGILFNHESPRRGPTFVTRKITKILARILAGKDRCIHLGNLDAKRDWGFAPEYVQAMHLLLQQDSPDDYVIGTGETHSVRDFLNTSLNYLGIEVEWQGEGVDEKAIIKGLNSDLAKQSKLTIGDPIIAIDPYYFRPAEVDYLLADISKAKTKLGWEPKIKFEELVKIMMDYDLQFEGLPIVGESKDILSTHQFNWTNHENLEVSL